MSDMTLAKRVGATLAAITVAGGLALASSGAAFADTAPAAGQDTCGVPGKPSQAKDTTKVHMLVPESPFADAATMTAGTPVGGATAGFDCHLRAYHSVGIQDYAQNNAEDPLGYSLGTHEDMTEMMLGQPGSLDEVQTATGTQAKDPFVMPEMDH